MRANTTSIIPEPTEAEIQHAAYLLWIESGKTPGRDLDNWLAAKELLKHRHGRGRPERRYDGVAAKSRHLHTGLSVAPTVST